MNEADTRAKLIDPALHTKGWNEEWIRREQTPGPVQIVGGGARHATGRIDYILSIRTQGRLLPIAYLEAKAEDRAPSDGLEQVKAYARLWSVPFVYSSNGHQFVEYDFGTGQTTPPRAMSRFPTWDTLRDRYHAGLGIDPADPPNRAILRAQRDGDRYYQSGAIRAVLKHLAAGNKRALLSLATGTGKTRIAVGILNAIADSEQPLKALFVCDRDELRSQALGALRQTFGADAAAARTNNPELNARVVVATYQTLGIAKEDDDASYLETHYPENYFTHIIIDEAHRSGWGKWRAVLDRNTDAVQIGLTATPRSFDYGGRNPKDLDPDDDQVRRDNYEYFGEPIFEYDITAAMQDGYLAAMQLIRSDIIVEGQVEQQEGVERERIQHGDIRDALTGGARVAEDLRERYQPGAIEAALLLPDRVEALADDLFQRLLDSGGPHQKTLIFCTRDHHADAVAAALNNRYAHWCAEHGQRRAEPYAFKCTANGGRELLPDLRSADTRAFIACTVELISTGVDVPRLQNIVFFRYLNSPIQFQQMLGRGTRIDAPNGKRHFTVYDYTNASRLLDQPLQQRAREAIEKAPRDTGEAEPVEVLEVSGITVEIRNEGARISLFRDGSLVYVTLDEYRTEVAQALLDELDSAKSFRDRWIAPDQRGRLLESLPEGAASAEVLEAAANQHEYDHYDILAQAAWQQTLRTRTDRAERYEQQDPSPIETALVRQFSQGGTDALEAGSLPRVPAIQNAGGLQAIGGSAEFTKLKRQLLATDNEWTQP